jgi:chromosomal replication initiator protein
VDNLTEIKETWLKVVDRLSAETGDHSVSLWVRPIKPVMLEGDTLKVEVPDKVIYDRVKSRYESRILALLAEIAGRPLNLSYTLSLTPPEPLAPAAAKPSPEPARRPPNYDEFNLNPNYTFESFITGPSNRFAVASAEAVSAAPGKSNPFFIYSPPGMGKTHLLHAIAHGILKSNPHAKILYTASENFVNEYIDAVRNKAGGAETFRSKYRKLDCLLLDDIQFLLDKERSQEEFFYTFDSLFQSKKQIVLTSDRPPRELAMDDRIISRFLQGVIADIKIPDFETRVAILRQKRDQHKYEIPDDVITFIAENVKKNIRELEGCLINVGNYCVNMRLQPTVDTVRELIKHYINEGEDGDRAVTIDIIKKVVAEHYRVEVRDLSAKKRNEAIAFPRMVAMYLAGEMTDLALTEIGAAFNREHSTVLHARGKIGHKLQTDPFFSSDLNKVISRIKSVSNQQE